MFYSPLSRIFQTAPTVYGAMYGLETFSQLVLYDESSHSYYIANTSVVIQDHPRFSWRFVFCLLLLLLINLAPLASIFLSIFYVFVCATQWGAVRDFAMFIIMVLVFSYYLHMCVFVCLLDFEPLSKSLTQNA